MSGEWLETTPCKRHDIHQRIEDQDQKPVRLLPFIATILLKSTQPAAKADLEHRSWADTGVPVAPSERVTTEFPCPYSETSGLLFP